MPFDGNSLIGTERMLESISELHINELPTAIADDTDIITDQDESLVHAPGERRPLRILAFLRDNASLRSRHGFSLRRSSEAEIDGVRLRQFH